VQVSKLEETLMLHIRGAKLEAGLEREHRFAAIATGGTHAGVRQRIKDAGMKDWRLDFAYPLRKLAIEVEGGTWTGGRHTRGQGFEDDTFKYNALTLMGWRLLRFTGTSIKSGAALQTIEAALRMDWAEPWVITA